MKKIFIVYVEHCNDGEVTIELYPYENKDKAIKRFEDEKKEVLILPCYSKPRDIDKTINKDSNGLPSLYITTLYDDYSTDIHIKVLEMLD